MNHDQLLKQYTLYLYLDYITYVICLFLILCKSMWSEIDIFVKFENIEKSLENVNFLYQKHSFYS